MGMLVNGVWSDEQPGTRHRQGEFVRVESAFRRWITADGSSGYQAEPGRYHLYIALSCPWAHRTLIYVALKGLAHVIGVSKAQADNTVQGWAFASDPANGARFLHEVYAKAQPDYTGRVTVPALWDRKTRTIVNNESAEIIRMLNSEFDAFAGNDLPDMYPQELRARIDAWNDRIYNTVNNGVYRAGFSTAQDKHEAAVRELFATFDALEEQLARTRYLCGERLTEADWRLFTTLVRFESVYHYHFKCNMRRLRDYPNLWAYTRELYQYPGVAETVDFDDIKLHYYRSQRQVNPSGVVPLGPFVDYREPHGRAAMAGR